MSTESGQGGVVERLMSKVNSGEARCCNCGVPFPVSPRAKTSSCPHCHRSVTIEDIKIKMLHWGGAIRTCGRVIVLKKARCLAREIVASGGVKIMGQVEGTVRSAGPVYVAAGGMLKGAVIAPSMQIEPGAVVEGGPFRVPGDYLADPDVVVRPGAAVSARSTGQPAPNARELNHAREQAHERVDPAARGSGAA